VRIQQSKVDHRCSEGPHHIGPVRDALVGCYPRFWGSSGRHPGRPHPASGCHPKILTGRTSAPSLLTTRSCVTTSPGNIRSRSYHHHHTILDVEGDRHIYASCLELPQGPRRTHNHGANMNTVRGSQASKNNAVADTLSRRSSRFGRLPNLLRLLLSQQLSI
jgi:hypothetical protein